MAQARAVVARRLPADLALVGVSAVLWMVSIYLNNEVLFQWTEEEEFVHWVFVPAGIRILLVMLFGWRAAFGMALGSVPWVLDVLPGVGAGTVAVTAMATGLMPWISVQLFSSVTGVRHPWHDLVWWHLPVIAGLSAFTNSAVLNGQLILVGLEPPRELPVNLLAVMIGDLLGALVLLLATVSLVRLIRTRGATPDGCR
ncbi:hypothetical protein [Stella sp.]|uniref:hypothetical protein n=1 Tax=Stella sp. TaxID=2912054 RepID=UPI0035B397C5